MKNTIIQWNCRGLRANYDELQLLLNDYDPTSNAGSKPTLAPPLSGMAQIKMGVVPSTSTQPNPAETKSTPKPAETKSAPNAKDKVDTGRTAKGSDDPIKTHNRYGAFNEDDMETEVTPSSPRRGIITRIPTILVA